MVKFLLEWFRRLYGRVKCLKIRPTEQKLQQVFLELNNKRAADFQTAWRTGVLPWEKNLTIASPNAMT
jgi:hypothetical protein